MKKYNIPNEIIQSDNIQNLGNREVLQNSFSHSHHSEDNNCNYFYSMLQNYVQNNQNIIQGYQPQINNEQYEGFNCSNGMISSLFTIVSQQANSLSNLSKKVQQIVQKNKKLLKKTKQLQIQNQLLKNNQGKKQQLQMHWKDNLNDVKVQGQSVNKQSLVKILFGKQKYQFELKLIQPLDLPLYRQRNFNIHMELVNMNNQRVHNTNKIPMSLTLYTCENPPKLIQKNTAGQKMLKGFEDQSLLEGICNFQKVQIKEVTSHYRGGWIFLVAMPCMTPLGTNKTENFIDFTKVKPLVIDEVVVKAKKPKKKSDKKQESEEIL